MKSKNRILYFLITMLVGIVLSCKDELPREDMENLPPDERVSIESDKEALYRYQTNKDMILYSLIQYDGIEQVYFLDATEKDMERLGITIEAYQDVQLRVEQLNQVKIEHQ